MKPGRTRTRIGLIFAGVALAGALVTLVESSLRLADVGVAHELHEFASPDGPVLTRFATPAELLREPAKSFDRVACTLAKPARTLRVVVVGESTAAGFPFFPRLSFARVLEARLRHDLPDLAIEVVNFGKAADASANVLQTVRDARACAPDVVVICSGHNEYQASYLDDLRDGIWPAIRRVTGGMRLAALLRPARAAGGEVPPEVAAAGRGALVGPRPFVNASEFARGERRLRGHLEAMVDACADTGALPLLVTQVANLSRFPPCQSFHARSLPDEVVARYDQQLRELIGLARSDPSGARAAELAKEAEAEDPDVALLRYAQGLRAEAAGDRKRAQDEFARALELDGYPNRARAAINRTIAVVAAEQSVALVDAAACFAAKSTLVAPGDDLFLDHCHPTLEGTFALADAILPELAKLLTRRGVALTALDATRATLAIEPLETWLASMGLDRKSLASGPVNAGQVDLKLYLLTPGVNEALRLARSAFTTALKLDPDALGAKVGMVVVELLDRHRETALQWQEQALSQLPAALLPVEEQSKSMRPLAEALHDLGLTFEQGRLVPVEPPSKGRK